MLITDYNYGINTNWRFWTFSAKFLPSQNIVPTKSCFCFEWYIFYILYYIYYRPYTYCSMCSGNNICRHRAVLFQCMLFCLHNLLIYSIIDNFAIDWSDKNCLKRWRLTYLDSQPRMQNEPLFRARAINRK